MSYSGWRRWHNDGCVQRSFATRGIQAYKDWAYTSWNRKRPREGFEPLFRPCDRGLLYIVRKLVVAQSKELDLWQVNGKFAMANYFSAGIDAHIAYDFNRDRKEGKIAGNSVLKNKLHYVKRFFADKDYRLKSGELHITDEFGKTKIFSLINNCTVIVGNIPSFAGGSNPFGKSDMADGLLEVLRIKSILNFLRAVSIGAGRFVVKAKEIEIHLQKDEFIQIDGEDFKNKLEMPISIKFGGKVNMLHL